LMSWRYLIAPVAIALLAPPAFGGVHFTAPFIPIEPSDYYGYSQLGNVAVGDLNLDQIPDLAIVTRSDSVRIYLGLGDGQFERARSVYAGQTPYTITLDDLDRDGRLVIVVTNYSGNSISVL